MAEVTQRVGPPGRRRSPSRGEGVLHASVVFGRVGGIEIGANWSWIAVFALIVWSLGAGVFPEENPGLSDGAYAAMAFAAAVLFFTSLVLHELGHALVAKREGMTIEGITLWVFGGVARFSGMFPSAGAELRIAIAGPIVSLVLGSAFVAVGALAPLPAAIDGVVTWLGRINLVLLAFNMLPALPLDGGRVLRSSLWYSTGDFTRATRIAGALGRGFGQVMIAGGILLMLFAGSIGGLWFALIGWFLTAAATAETSLATMRDALGGLTVADAMVHAPIVVPDGMTLQRFVDEVFARSRHASYPVVSDGEIAGLLPFRRLTRVRPAQWPQALVRDAMLPVADVLLVRPGDPLGDAAVELGQSPLGRALVVEDTRLVGLLSITDVSRILELRRLEAVRPRSRAGDAG